MLNRTSYKAHEFFLHIDNDNIPYKTYTDNLDKPDFTTSSGHKGIIER